MTFTGRVRIGPQYPMLVVKSNLLLMQAVQDTMVKIYMYIYVPHMSKIFKIQVLV